MKLGALLQSISYKEFTGNAETEISGLCTDSQKIRQGELFFCYEGENHDSHDFAEEAVAAGAAAIVCERKLDLSLPQIIVEDGRSAVAPLARAYYGYADKKMKMVAVTGTNGKTTTTYMLESIFKAAGRKTGVIGTLGISYSGKFISPELTTPDPVFLHNILADMAVCGVEFVFMEVSAHALHFGKIDGIHYEVGIFTNFTQDHLDFFGNMHDYADSKKLLFKDGRCGYAVINSDDKLGRKMLSELNGAISYGLKNPADVFAVDVAEKINGTSFVINIFDELYEMNLNIPALHNVYNAMSASACAKILGVSTENIAAGLNNLKTVEGRLERVARYNGAEIFVDFAHTPDGLEKSLQALKKLCKGKLYCLFGCGGNRDKTKRPLMGEIAARNADFCIVTSDNPRFEDPYEIITQIEAGIRLTGKEYVTVTERETATEYAIKLLSLGDILLVAGKGGEYYQEIMGIKHSYNDNEVIKKIIG
ncbi:MAG: UDP-N-acetylmuramoyl-L-alanyl-D-glutamate--2,6-diaminopimelate ligase [Clostridia bacterium]|nr:UDP-N-acetylmuramoyl-L-alanyl-D-glutamate--2,6-diaminopimelate ligase [Clostridia bacterium]